jgi:mitochondrial fission protein ELM1
VSLLWSGISLSWTGFKLAEPHWLSSRLAIAALVWVTQDSVSMLYEALTAGAATGLLAVPRRRLGRVGTGLHRRVEAGKLTPFAAWYKGTALKPPVQALNEASRCARWIVAKWLDAH